MAISAKVGGRLGTVGGRGGREGEEMRPNQQCTLDKLPTELRCRKFVDEHRLRMQIGAKRAKKKPVHATWYIFRLSFHFCTPPLMVGRVFSSRGEGSTKLSTQPYLNSEIARQFPQTAAAAAAAAARGFPKNKKRHPGFLTTRISPSSYKSVLNGCFF